MTIQRFNRHLPRKKLKDLQEDRKAYSLACEGMRVDMVKALLHEVPLRFSESHFQVLDLDG